MIKDHSCTAETSAIWKDHVAVANTPPGFRVRTTYPGNPAGVEVMLEQWQAGSEEPIHSHPGDDMTVVVEGKISIQFYVLNSKGERTPDGERLILHKGETGYIKAGRLHDAKYIEHCKLVYVHDKKF